MSNKPLGGIPLFIVGYSRSGTKMMNQILDFIGVSDIVPEIHFFGQLYNFEKVENNSKSKKELELLLDKLIYNVKTSSGKGLNNDVPLKEVRKDIIEFIDNAINPLSPIDVYKKFIAQINTQAPIDPTPRNAYYIRNILELIPDSNFIYMLRDPRDCILSQSVKWKKYAQKKKYSNAFRYKVNYNPSLMAKFWKNSYSEYKAVEKDKRVHLVKYEDITQYPYKTVRKLSSFLGVSISKNIDLSFIRSNNSKKWKRKYSKSDVYSIEFILAEEMKKAGYKRSQFSFIEKFFGTVKSCFFWLKAPFAFVINLPRMKDPISIFRRRLLKK